MSDDTKIGQTILAQTIVVSNQAAQSAATAKFYADQVADKAPLASPVFTGIPRAPTADPGNDSTQIATTEYLDRLLGTANGIATLDSGGLIPASQLPSLALTQIYTVNSQAAMLALAADVGDIAIRTDVNETFILSAAPPSVLGNWTELLFAVPVTSVAGLIGAISAAALTAALNVAVGDSGAGGLQGLLPAAAAGDAAANKYYKASGAFQTVLVAEVTGAAPLASPTFTGVPVAPTASVDTDTGQLATTAFVLNQQGTATPLMDGTAAPGTSLRFTPIDHIHPTDTSRAPLASPTFTGTPAAPTASPGTNTTQLATTAFVAAALASAGVTSFNGRSGMVVSVSGDYSVAQVTGAAPLASPTFTGSPAAPTQTSTDNSTLLATTAFVQAVAALSIPSCTIAMTLLSAAPSGWLLFDDGTVGDGTSGASYANALSVNVFTALYAYSDANCPLLTSAGGATTRAAQGTAAAAFAAHCRMTLPKVLGRSLASAGAGSGLTSRALGDKAGAETFTPTLASTFAHSHSGAAGGTSNAQAGSADSNAITSGGSTGSAGSSTPFGIIDPTSYLGNVMVKL